MIEINLLPHRQARRVADLRQSLSLLVLGMVLVCGGIGFVHTDTREKIRNAEAQVRQLQSDIEQYKPQEQKVADFKKQRRQLEEKLDVIRGLDRARSGPIRLLDELADRTPERLWITKLSTNAGQLTVEGESLDTGVVADFLRSLNASPYFADVDLDKTTPGKAVQGVKLVNFVITANLATPAESAEEEQA